MSRCRTILVLLALAFVSAAQIPTHADIYRWDNGELIPGTEGPKFRSIVTYDNSRGRDKPRLNRC